MAMHFDIAECFRKLILAKHPDQLWEIVDALLATHPYSDRNLGICELKKDATTIVLYGAGMFAESVIECWRKEGIRPAYCVDSDARKWGTSVQGIPVRAPRDLFEEKRPVTVAIAAMATQEIEKTLDASGIDYVYAERDGILGLLPGHWLYRHRQDFERVYSAMADDASRHVLLEVAKARMFQWCRFPMRGNFFSSDAATYPQYFRDDLFSFSDNEFFVDCGAFDGDTLIAFSALMLRLGKPSWKAVAFEADKDNLEQIHANLTRYGIGQADVVCAAVGKGNTVESSSRYFNCRQDGERHDVKTVSLDEALRDAVPTFIKMDIEGHEVDALAGARQVISRHQPKLAICAYHTSAQLLEVPLFIMENFPGYRLHLRHHSAGTLWETVCYAHAGQ